MDLHSMIFVLVYIPLVVTRLQEGSGYLKTIKVKAPRVQVLHLCVIFSSFFHLSTQLLE